MNKCQITQITINLFHIHVSDVSDHKLSSSGREDVDVRMLGLGRPFVVELINPHASTFTREDIALLQKVMCRSPHERYVKKCIFSVHIYVEICSPLFQPLGIVEFFSHKDN